MVDLYTQFLASVEGARPSAELLRDALSATERGARLLKIARGWDIDLAETAAWMASPRYAAKKELAMSFLKSAPRVVAHVEGLFGGELPGEVWLAPSLEWFDGFARFDHGEHHVIFGVDHPDADEAYLRALMAHELSHVYRDHRPEVWRHLGKPVGELKRREYLEAQTAREHLVSEGLATLFSQLAYPEVPLNVHHYYEQGEMSWCLDNHDQVDTALRACLREQDENVWSFYGEGRAGPGSPARTHYYWAAHVLRGWLEALAPARGYAKLLVEAHGWPAERFDCFGALEATS